MSDLERKMSIGSAPSEAGSEVEKKYRCKKRCKRRCKVVLLALLAATLIVFAVDQHKHNDYPKACFVDDDDEDESERLEDAAEAIEDVVEECETQVTQLCGTELSATTSSSLASVLTMQQCIGLHFYQFSDDCREELSDSGLFGEVLFPNTLYNEDLVETAIDACEDDAEDLCRRQARHFDDDNMCQVMEIGLCLQSQLGEVSQACTDAVLALNLTMPLDYDEDDYSLENSGRHRGHHRHHFFGALLHIFGVLVILKLCHVVVKVYRRRKAEKAKAAAETSINPSYLAFNDAAPSKRRSRDPTASDADSDASPLPAKSFHQV